MNPCWLGLPDGLLAVYPGDSSFPSREILRYGAGPGNVPRVVVPYLPYNSRPLLASVSRRSPSNLSSAQTKGGNGQDRCSGSPWGTSKGGQMGSTVAGHTFPKEYWLLNNLTFLFKIWTTVGHRMWCFVLSFLAAWYFGFETFCKKKIKRGKELKKGKSRSTTLSNHPFLHPPLSWTLCYPK